ncbi:MAG: flagellar motor protein MotB [Candidatus Kapaibacterium sp.]
MSTEQPIIIKKRRKAAHHGHHGGAWKVAYADFVTAMMAFFLVMWILGLSEQTKKHVANFFREPGVFENKRGRQIPLELDLQPGSRGNKGNGAGKEKHNAETASGFRDQKEAMISDDVRKALSQAAYRDSIRITEAARSTARNMQQAKSLMMSQSADMRESVKNMTITLDDEALRIELVEMRDDLFFSPGSDRLKPIAIKLLKVVASYLSKMENHIYIEGHTDAKQYPGSVGGYSKWDLSSNRANAARRILESNGLWADQITNVVACADKSPINTDNPFDASNRRITIVVPMMKQSDLLKKKIDEYLSSKPSADAGSATPADRSTSSLR